MPKIISRRGKPETPEVDIELNLDELDKESIVVTTAGEDDDGQLTFEYYKEDWVIQHRFVTRLHEMGCWVVHSIHECTWKVFYRDVQVVMVTDYAVQSDTDAVLDYVRDTIEAINSITKNIVQP